MSYECFDEYKYCWNTHSSYVSLYLPCSHGDWLRKCNHYTAVPRYDNLSSGHGELLTRCCHINKLMFPIFFPVIFPTGWQHSGSKYHWLHPAWLIIFNPTPFCRWHGLGQTLACTHAYNTRMLYILILYCKLSKMSVFTECYIRTNAAGFTKVFIFKCYICTNAANSFPKCLYWSVIWQKM